MREGLKVGIVFCTVIIGVVKAVVQQVFYVVFHNRILFRSRRLFNGGVLSMRRSVRVRVRSGCDSFVIVGIFFGAGLGVY
jgi:hypothetical protein